MTLPGWLFPRSISLAAQLLLAFVGLVVVTTTALTVAAYRASLETLVTAALSEVRLAARSREQTLTRILRFRQQRAEGLLLSLQSICAEPAGSRGFGWSEECVRTMVEEYRRTERASGAALVFRGRELQVSGLPPAAGRPLPGALALVVPNAGSVSLLLTASRGDATLRLQFDATDLSPIFEDRAELGRTGEVFLTDSEGHFLTQARYASAPGTPAGAAAVEPLMACRAEGEIIGLDYRGVLTIHGYRPVEALGGGCVEAHVSYDEALEPAEAMRAELAARGVVFVVIGALLSLLAANRIAAPVRRLARSARALQAGSFDEPIPVAGPSEVRALGRAFAAMAQDLAKLVTGEQAARYKAESANKSKDQFLAVVSHELRTPLNAVLGWTRMLSTGHLDEQRTRRALDAIERNAEVQQRLIEDLLDVSRIVAGRFQLMRAPVRLADVVEAAVEAVRPRAMEKQVALDVTIDDRDVVIVGDEQRLEQVVWNLMTNAVKFTPAGGAVALTLHRDAVGVELTVTDTGIGIAPEFLPHVFEWFRQAHDVASRGADSGLGLGLGLVQELVELHGGSVAVTSPGEGHGSRFTVRLPVFVHSEAALGA